MKRRGLSLLLLLLAITALACGLGTDDDGPPRNAAVVQVMANTSLQPWLEAVVATYNEAENETGDGQRIWIEPRFVDAGQAVTEIQGGAAPALWIPDSRVWVDVLAQEGKGDFRANCESVARSPLVIAMWQPLAESLGWPGRDLGWLDVGSLAADPTFWAYYSGGQFGEALRLGHTHPGLSATGAHTLLAIVQAAESKTEAVSVADIEQPIVQASVGAFEGAVTWFSSSTASLGQTMRERGTDFLGAAVMYESDVVHYGAGGPETGGPETGGPEMGEPPIVPIYPFEGTFIADHPACLNAADEAQVAMAARLFRDYLLGEGQTAAVAHGLRPAAEGEETTPEALVGRGVDWSQPEVAFAPPTVDALYAVQALWQAARKEVNLVMVVDVSGSMYGPKMDSVRESAVQFVRQMGDDDYISIIAFSSSPQILVRHQRVGDDRDGVINVLQSLEAYGDTALFDAIYEGAALIEETSSPETANALVVLSDGLDTSSFRHDSESAVEALFGTEATVFTIAYGTDADEALLEQMALRANGNFFLGDEASIDAIYQEMSAAFGGAVGVGR